MMTVCVTAPLSVLESGRNTAPSFFNETKIIYAGVPLQRLINTIYALRNRYQSQNNTIVLRVVKKTI